MSDLRALADLLPFFAVGGDAAGAWVWPEPGPDGVTQLPRFREGPALAAFHRAAHDGGWMRPGFAWGAWSATPEARALMQDPAALARATPEDLARLITLLVRRDRFAEGSLAAAAGDGLIARILMRAGALAG